MGSVLLWQRRIRGRAKPKVKTATMTSCWPTLAGNTITTCNLASSSESSEAEAEAEQEEAEAKPLLQLLVHDDSLLILL